MTTYIYIFDKFPEKDKFSPFITKCEKEYKIMIENKESLNYIEYKSNLISSVKRNVDIIEIEKGMNIILNENSIESFYQLSIKNVEFIYNTLVEYKNGESLIFLID
jgi:hypothetical protein